MQLAAYFVITTTGGGAPASNTTTASDTTSGQTTDGQQAPAPAVIIDPTPTTHVNPTNAASPTPESPIYPITLLGGDLAGLQVSFAGLGLDCDLYNSNLPDVLTVNADECPITIHEGSSGIWGQMWGADENLIPLQKFSGDSPLGDTPVIAGPANGAGSFLLPGADTIQGTTVYYAFQISDGAAIVVLAEVIEKAPEIVVSGQGDGQGQGQNDDKKDDDGGDA